MNKKRINLDTLKNILITIIVICILIGIILLIASRFDIEYKLCKDSNKTEHYNGSIFLNSFDVNCSEYNEQVYKINQNNDST